MYNRKQNKPPFCSAELRKCLYIVISCVMKFIAYLGTHVYLCIVWMCVCVWYACVCLCIVCICLCALSKPKHSCTVTCGSDLLVKAAFATFNGSLKTASERLMGTARETFSSPQTFQHISLSHFLLTDKLMMEVEKETSSCSTVAIQTAHITVKRFQQLINRVTFTGMEPESHSCNIKNSHPLAHIISIVCLTCRECRQGGVCVVNCHTITQKMNKCIFKHFHLIIKTFRHLYCLIYQTPPICF